MNAPLKTRAAREFTIQVKVRQAAATLATAVYCNLALLRVSVDKTVFQDLWTSAYTLIQRIIQGKPCTGTVPLPIFQLLASLRARVVDLKNGQVLALRVQTYTGETAPHLPAPPADALGSGVSIFCHYSSQLMGALVDLKEIDRDFIDPIPEKGYRNRVSIGKSLGPLNFSQSQSGRYGIAALQQKYEKTEEWMSHFTWAYLYSPTGNYDTHFLDYPAVDTSIGEIPPEIPILTTALRIAEVIGADKFDFPALDIATIHAYLKANALGRTQQYDVIGKDKVINARVLPDDFKYDLRNALAAASAVGLKAGQPAFTQAFLRSNEHLIPQDIAESCIAGPSVRSTIIRIPYVFTITKNSVGPTLGSYPVADGTVDGVHFAIAATTTGKIKVGISNAEMSTGASAFLNATYDAQNVKPQLTWTGAPPIWGGTTTVTSAGTLVPLTTFNNTIGAGPLSKPCGDKPIRGLNFADLTADRVLKVDATSGLTVLAYASINSYTGGLKSENLQILSSFPLAREAVVTAGSTVQFTKTPYTRTQLDIIDPAFKAVPHTVVEPGAAKCTEVQSLISNFNRTGMGGDGLFGDVARRAGLAIGSVAMNTASAAGTYLAGSAVNALHEWYHGDSNKKRRDELNNIVRPVAQVRRQPRQNVGVAGNSELIQLLRRLDLQGQRNSGRNGQRRRNRGRGGKTRGNQRRR